eukprot:GHVP01058842.1.p1 GENE.GHVP01058842.1~~GHVP01058842.1.p1  ORF type:complete len:914 (+),score=140.31 GHVP01058842.1:1679-4420(+)
MSLELADLFNRSLSPSENKTAEKELDVIQKDPFFIPNVILFIREKTFSIASRLAASLYLKNLVKNNWQNDDSIFKDKKEAVRKDLFNASISVEESIASHLIDSVSLIAKYDFPSEWLDLLPTLCSLIESPSQDICLSGLTIAATVFERYRYECRSDELFTEINIVMKDFAPSFFSFLKRNFSVDILDPSCNKKIQKLRLSSEIFYSLSYQDLPEYIEDHITEFMSIFHGLLQIEQAMEYDGELSQIDTLHKTIFNILQLYASKYSEEFVGIDDFISISLKTLLNIKNTQELDPLFIAIAGFLSETVPLSICSHFFTEDLIQTICDKIVFPNLQLRESDLEMFEDEPLDFVRFDLEGASLESRRHVSGKLFKRLLQKNETLLKKPIENTLVSLLQKYNESPTTSWLAKDTALYLLSCISSKEQETNTDIVHIPQFFAENVQKDLLPVNDAFNPIIKVDAIRFLISFRKVLTKDQLLSTLPLLKHHLKSHNIAVSSYSAIAIEKILYLKKDNNLLLNEEDLKYTLEGLVYDILKVIRSSKTIHGMCENEFYIKTLVRILSNDYKSQNLVNSHTVSELCWILETVSKQPEFPLFNYLLFEAFASIVVMTIRRYNNIENIEQIFLPVFQNLLVNEVSEMMPFIFRILAYVLETIPEQKSPQMLLSILPAILTPALWSDATISSSLARLVTAYTIKLPSIIVQYGYTDKILGIFQLLIGCVSNEQWAFKLISSFILYMPEEIITKYLRNILIVTLTKIQSSKTKKTSIGFVLFLYSLFLTERLENGVRVTINILEGIQNNLFQVILDSFISKSGSYAYNEEEKLIALNGIYKLLLEENIDINRSTTLLRTAIEISHKKQVSKTRSNAIGETIEASTFNLAVLEHDIPLNIKLIGADLVLAEIYNLLRTRFGDNITPAS